MDAFKSNLYLFLIATIAITGCSGESPSTVTSQQCVEGSVLLDDVCVKFCNRDSDCGSDFLRCHGATCVAILCTDNPCAAGVTCTDTETGYVCGECPQGFYGNGQTCTDTNECDSTTSPCSEHATCTNTEGSYECTCNFPLGFFGDGDTCEPITNCEPGHYQTHLPTVTTDRVCEACPEGTFSATTNAEECIEWSECPEGQHVITSPSATQNRECSDCPDGFVGDGQICTDINECTAATSPCSANARCTNTEGSFNCACNSGFFGNGVTCEPITNCEPGHHETQSPTSTTNRVCEACPLGTFSATTNAAQCESHTQCTAATSVAIAPSATKDRLCKQTIQGAIDASLEGDIIRVSPGTYPENLVVPHSLSIFGDFVTTRESTSIDETVISAPDSDGDGIFEGSVISITGEGSAPPMLTLTGLTLKNGVGTNYNYRLGGLEQVRRVGGAIKCVDAVVIGNHLKLENNSAQLGAGAFLYSCPDSSFADTEFTNNNATHEGGGAFIENSDSCTINNNEFISNTAGTADNADVEGLGGGLTVKLSNSVSIRDTLFESNSTTNAGGALGGHDNDNLVIENTSFENNRSDAYRAGGGVDLRNGDGLRISGCTFKENHAKFGAALNLLYQKNGVIQDSRFTGNRSLVGGGAGAGIKLHASELIEIDRCEFIQNAVDEPRGNGGSIYAFASSGIEVNHSLFANNVAGQNGGALFLRQCTDVDLTHLTFFGNNVVSTVARSLKGGSITLRDHSEVTIKNSIFSGAQDDIDYVSAETSSTAAITYSNLFDPDNAECQPDEHFNINCDPQFVNSAGGVFTLAADSPCINAGEDGVSMGAGN